MARPVRVSITETRAERFFKAGTSSIKACFDPGMVRVPVCYRWKNLPPPYGDGMKLIDLTGMLANSGQAFACEVKQKDLNAADPRFSYSQIADRQRDFLWHTRVNGGVAWLFLGFVRGKKPIATFLVPWDTWLYIEGHHARKFKDGHEKLWRSISHEWVRYYAPWSELYPWPYRTASTRKKYTFFTHLECQRWLVGYDADKPNPAAMHLNGAYAMHGG